jgi:hypothetical protein
MKKSYLEKLFESKNLAPATFQKYNSGLKKLNDGNEIVNINFLKDYDCIIDQIDSYSLNGKRNILIAVVSAIRSLKIQSKPWREVLNKYLELLNTLNSELSVQNEKNDKVSDAWLTEDVINDKMNELILASKRLSRKKILTKGEYTTIVSTVILGLYTMLPPRRESAYMDLLISDQSIPSENTISIKDKSFTFNKYKTVKTYGEQVVKIPNKLMSLIKIYLKFHPTKDGVSTAPLFIKYNGLKETKSFILKILSKLFGKSVGSASFRRMYITNKYDKIFTEMDKDAEEMGTSVDMLKNHYVKR